MTHGRKNGEDLLTRAPQFNPEINQAHCEVGRLSLEPNREHETKTEKPEKGLTGRLDSAKQKERRSNEDQKGV